GKSDPGIAVPAPGFLTGANAFTRNRAPACDLAALRAHVGGALSFSALELIVRRVGGRPGQFAGFKLLQAGKQVVAQKRLFRDFECAFQIYAVAGLDFKEPVCLLHEGAKRLLLPGSPPGYEFVELPVALNLVKTLLENGALLVHFVAAGVVTDAEVTACPIGLLETVQLMDTTSRVARSVTYSTGKFEGKIKVARCAFAIGIDHHQHGPPAQ